MTTVRWVCICLLFCVSTSSALEGRALLINADPKKTARSCPGDLMLATIHSETNITYKTLVKGKAFGPVFSPDGSKIAYTMDRKVYTINVDGSGNTEITTCGPQKTNPAMNWPSDNHLYWSEKGSKNLFRVYLATKKKETVHTAPHGMVRAQVSLDATRTSWMKTGWQVWVADIGKKGFRVAKGCGGSLSPSGKYATRNFGSHKKADIHRIGPNGPEGVVAVIQTPEHTFNGHRFSRSDDYIVYTLEPPKSHGYIYEWKKGTHYKIAEFGIWDFCPKEQGKKVSSK